MKNRKILSAVITAAILVGSVTPAAYAESGQENAWTAESTPSAQAVDAEAIASASDLTTAISEADAGATLTLSQDITLTSTLTISKNITLNLNGKKLTVAASGYGIEVSKGAKLTIDDTTGGSIVNPGTKTGGYLVHVKGEVELKNGTLTNESGAAVGSYMVRILEGTFTMSGGAVVCAGGAYGAVKVEDDAGSTFIMNAGTVSNIPAGGSSGVANVSDNLLFAVDDNAYTAILNFGTTEIKGGTVNGAVWASAATPNGYTGTDNPTVTISGTAAVNGALIVGESRENKANSTNNPAINVTGGTVTGSVAWTNQASGMSDLENYGGVEISGGNVTINKALVPTVEESDAVKPTISIDTENATVKIKDETSLEKINAILPEDEQLAEVDETTGEVVKAKPCTKLELNKTTAEIEIDETVTLTATATPADTTDKVEWASSDDTVATVADGVVTGKKAGTATITATCGEKTAECTVKVTEAAAAEYTITDNTTDTNGTVTIKNAAGTAVTKAAEGDKITITAVGKTGYTLDTLKVNGTAVTADENGAYVHTMTAANTTVAATFKAVKAEDTATKLAAGGQKKYDAVLSADGKTYEQDCVLVLSADDVKNESVTVTVKAGSWTASKEVKVCYKTVVYKNADGSTDTVTSEGNFLIAVHVKNLPTATTAVEYSFK